MRVNLATDYKTRTGAPDKDARQKNSYIEVKNEQAIVRKRPSAQGGVSVGTGTAQGGYGTVLFWGDTAYPITEGTLTTCNNATNYVQGDHVTVDMVDYWANTSTVNTCPVGGVAGSDWSTSYVAAVGALPVVYATLDPSTKGVNVTLSGGDLVASVSSATSGMAISTISKTAGKWYWEVTVTSFSGGAPDLASIGVVGERIAIMNEDGYVGDSAFSYGYLGSGSAVGGEKYNSGGSTAYGANYVAGDVIGIALNADAGDIYFYKNGVSQGAAFSGVAPEELESWYAGVSGFSSTSITILTVNFGATAFAYSVPSGYNSGLYE